MVCTHKKFLKEFNGSNLTVYLLNRTQKFSWFVHELKYFHYQKQPKKIPLLHFHGLYIFKKQSSKKSLPNFHGLYMNCTRMWTKTRIPFYTLYRGRVPFKKFFKKFLKNFFECSPLCLKLVLTGTMTSHYSVDQAVSGSAAVGGDFLLRASLVERLNIFTWRLQLCFEFSL